MPMKHESDADRPLMIGHSPEGCDVTVFETYFYLPHTDLRDVEGEHEKPPSQCRDVGDDGKIKASHWPLS